MAGPQLIALNRLGEIRSANPTLFQVIQELQQEVNAYILRQASATGAADEEGSSRLFSQTADGPTISNTTTTSSILGAGDGSLTIPANTLALGSTIRLTVRGTCSSTTPDTLSVQIQGAGGIWASVAAMTVPGGAGSGFEMTFLGTVRSAGSSGTIRMSGVAFLGSGAVPIYVFGLGGGDAAVNTVAANPVDVRVTWSAAHATSTITAKTAVLEVL